MRDATLKITSALGLSLFLTAQALPASGAMSVPSSITKWLKSGATKKKAVPANRRVSQKKISRIAVVAPIGGNYTSPVTAMNNLAAWCGTPSDTNRCLLQIMPGVYDLAGASLNMQPYVDIEGSGETSTIITSAVNAFYGVVNGADSAELSSLTVQNTATTGTVMAIANQSDQSTTLTHVTAIAAGHGDENYAIFSIQCVPTLNFVTASAAGANSNFGVYFGNAASVMNDVNATVGDGTDSFAVVVAASSTAMNNVTANASGATNNYGLFNADSSSNVTNSTATASGVNSYGVFNADGTLYLTNVSAAGWGSTAGYGLYNTFSPGTANADRCTFEGSTGSVFTDNYFGVLIGASKLIGPATALNGSTLICVNSYNGNYVPLGPDCQ